MALMLWRRFGQLIVVAISLCLLSCSARSTRHHKKIDQYIVLPKNFEVHDLYFDNDQSSITVVGQQKLIVSSAKVPEVIVYDLNENRIVCHLSQLFSKNSNLRHIKNIAKNIFLLEGNIYIQMMSGRVVELNRCKMVELIHGESSIRDHTNITFTGNEDFFIMVKGKYAVPGNLRIIDSIWIEIIDRNKDSSQTIYLDIKAAIDFYNMPISEMAFSKINDGYINLWINGLGCYSIDLTDVTQPIIQDKTCLKKCNMDSLNVWSPLLGIGVDKIRQETIHLPRIVEWSNDRLSYSLTSYRGQDLLIQSYFDRIENILHCEPIYYSNKNILQPLGDTTFVYFTQKQDSLFIKEYSSSEVFQKSHIDYDSQFTNEARDITTFTTLSY